MGYYETLIALTGINIILAISLNLINGIAGQFSMGHAGFMCVGAYVASFLTTQFPVLQSPTVFLFVLILAGIAGALLGLVVGIPTLRLRGDYLAVVTLGFGEMIRVVILNIEAVGGARGIREIPKLANLYWILGFCVLTYFTIKKLVQSQLGRAIIAVREDQIAAESVGVSSTKTKVTVFVIGAFFAGIAGALFAHTVQFINPQSFDLQKSFEIIIMVVMGGMGSLPGSVIAAILLTLLKEVLRPLQEITHLDLRMVIFSLLLIILMLFRPQGLLGKNPS